MDIRPIRTEVDYEWALEQISRYFDAEPEPGSAEGDRFEILIDLTAAYEAKRFPMADVDPVDALKAFMEMRGRSQGELADLLGSRSRASEILNRRRAMTVDMIHTISKAWGVPAELLVRPYPLAA